MESSARRQNWQWCRNPKLDRERVRVSQGVSQGLLIYRVEPKYPPIAQQAHIQGIVILTAVIDKDGIIQRLQLVSGHPMLATAAIDAVKQWR